MEELRMGDYVCLHPARLPHLTYYGEQAWGLNIRVATPSKAHLRDLQIHLAFFQLQPCDYVGSGQAKSRGEAVKNGDEVSLRHVHTGKSLMACAQEEGLRFCLGEGTQTWLRLHSFTQAVGASLRYSLPLAILSPISAVPHYLSLSTLDDISYTASASLHPGLILVQPLSRSTALLTHYPLRLRHRELGLLLAQEEGTPKLTSWDDTSYWTWEPIQEMKLGPVEAGERYYLRSCACGRYLSSTQQLVSQPDLSCALLISTTGAEEVTLETRDHHSLGKGPNIHLRYQRSFETYYELEPKQEVELVWTQLPAQAFLVEEMPKPLVDFIRAVGDLCMCLKDPTVPLEADAAQSLVQRVSNDIDSQESDRALKQRIALGAGLVEAGFTPQGLWTSDELFRSLLSLLCRVIQGNHKAAQRAAGSLAQLQRLLSLSTESASLLGVIFKSADLPMEALGPVCRDWLQRLEPVTNANVVSQTHMLKLLRRLGEVSKRPARIVQAEVLLAAPKLLSVCKVKGRACVQLYGIVPLAELSAAYQQYVYYVLRLLALACYGNHQPGLATLVGLGVTPEFLLEQQVSLDTPVLLRAAFVRLTTILVCEAAGSSPALRTPGNLVYTLEEVARGPVRTRPTGPLAAVLKLSLDFWRESNLDTAPPHSIVRLVIANLQQVLCVVQTGLATQQFITHIVPALLNIALAITNPDKPFSEKPAEALRRLGSNGDLGEKEGKAILEWVLRITRCISEIDAEERALAAVRARDLSAAQHRKGWTRFFSFSKEEPEAEEALLKLLFCTQHSSQSAVCSAVEQLRDRALANPIATSLDWMVVLETEAEMRLWSSLQRECQQLRHALLSNSSAKLPLTGLLDLLHKQAYTTFADFHKAQRMSWSLGLLDLLAQVCEDQESRHLAWMVALQCVGKDKSAGQRFLCAATWNLQCIELPAFGLMLKEVTGFEYLGEDEGAVEELLHLAMALPPFRARRYLAFLSFLQIRPDLQLLTAYCLRDEFGHKSPLEADLLQLLSLVCSNPTAAECTRSWFTIREPAAEDWACAQAWTAVRASLNADKDLLTSIEMRLEPLQSPGHPCYSALPSLARAGLYSKVWPRATPALPYRALFQPTSKPAYLELWEALLSEEIPGLETGFLLTLAAMLKGSKAIGVLGSVFVSMHETLLRMETANPDLCFTQLLSVLSSLTPNTPSPPPTRTDPIDLQAQLFAAAQLPDPNTAYQILARRVLQLDYFTRTADGRKRLTAAIHHVLTLSSAEAKTLLLPLFKEICSFDRQESETERALNSAVWLDSGLIESALEGVRQSSSRVIASLEVLAEVTQGQLAVFQSRLLECFQRFSFQLFSLLQTTLKRLLVSFRRGDTPDPLTSRTAELLLTLLENCCEGSHEAFQLYFLFQPSAQGSINVVQQISAFVIALLDCWHGTEEQEFLLGQALEALVNFVTGPCLSVQRQLISNGALLRALTKTLRQAETAAVSPALVRAELRVSRLLNTLVEGDDEGREGLVEVVDMELLLQAIIRVYESCIKGKEREIALGRLKDEVALARVEFAFQLYTFLLELRESAPTLAPLAVLTEVQHTARGRVRAWLEEHIFPPSYSHPSCFHYFAAHTGYVEVARDSQLSSLYFRIPVHCRFLPTATKEQLVNQDRTERQEDLQKVLLEVPRLEAEMLHQQRLSRWPWLKAVTRLVGPLDTLTMLLIVTINLMLLVQEDREKLFALKSQEGRLSGPTEALAVVIWVAAIAHYVAYIIEFYPRVTVESGRRHSLSFHLYSLIPHNDSLLMQPWVEMAQQTWVRRLPSCLRSLFKLLFSAECFTKLVLLAAAVLAVPFPIFSPFLLLWFLPSYAALRHILKAITMNGQQLILTCFFCLLVVLMFTEIYFIRFSAYFVGAGKGNAQYSTFCEDLGTCFVSVLDWGVRMGGGVGEALASSLEDRSTYAKRLPLDLLFFIIINIIILKIVFGIILDALGELREARWASERDMYKKCFICRRTRNQLELHGAGWTPHILYEHSLFAYVAYTLYVLHKDKKDCSGLELYVKRLVEKADPAFFPQTSKVLWDRGLT